MARKRDDGWQGDVTLPAPHGRKRLSGFATKAQAEAWETSLTLAAEEGRPLPSRTGTATSHPGAAPASAGGVTLGALQRLVADAVWRGQKAEVSSIRNGEAAVKFFGANMPAASITTTEVDRYIAAMVDAGSSNGTINRKLAALSKLLRHAFTRGKITAMPHIDRKREPQGRERVITAAEEARILATLRLWGEREYADFAEFLLDTGCRLSEGLTLRWEAVTLPRVTFFVTKGGKPRTIPLTPRAQAVIGRCDGNLHDGPFMDINEWRLRDCWNKLRGHLKLPDVLIHTLRHTCCTRLVQRGFDLSRVQTWMGHRTYATTVRYRHLVTTDLDSMALGLTSPEALGAARVPNPVPVVPVP